MIKLFCKHIWQECGAAIELRTEREPVRVKNITYYYIYKYYAVKYKCLRCNKEKIEEVRVWQI
jgi:hypothetical protein